MADNISTAAHEGTAVGSYFVANYPPFSVWTDKSIETDTKEALDTTPNDVPLGLYLHIPFCRKRCHFCYFRVYTDKNANDVKTYLKVLSHEWELYNKKMAIEGRQLNFVYFGGGTPSFLSVHQLKDLVSDLKSTSSWDNVEEITFECEPGTLTENKLTLLQDLGITRISFGVENFDDQILESNGRAHRSPEIFHTYEFAKSLKFPQINIDLIAGMLGETDKNWESCVHRTIEMSPDSVTIYQMELPFNTTISNDILKGTSQFPTSVASWTTKRRWVKEAFGALEAAGYTVASAYTAVKDTQTAKFLYRDCLWQGADLVGLGVASFGYINGVHLQNLDTFEAYRESLEQDQLPLNRSFRPTEEEKLIREVILQFKLGSISPNYFLKKYDVDVLQRFKEPLDTLGKQGYLTANSQSVTLSREGLLRVDSWLPRFFLPKHTGIRYT